MTKNLSIEAKNDITALAESYRSSADLLTGRIDELRALIAKRPPYKELTSLETRLEILRTERRELLAAAAHLSRLAAPPPLHPSLLHRERDAS